MWANEYGHWSSETPDKVFKTTNQQERSWFGNYFLGYECARWDELTIDDTVLGTFVFKQFWEATAFQCVRNDERMLNLGRICTDIQLVNDGFLTRLLRFSRSTDKIQR